MPICQSTQTLPYQGNINLPIELVNRAADFLSLQDLSKMSLLSTELRDIAQPRILNLDSLRSAMSMENKIALEHLVNSAVLFSGSPEKSSDTYEQIFDKYGVSFNLKMTLESSGEHDVLTVSSSNKPSKEDNIFMFLRAGLVDMSASRTETELSDRLFAVLLTLRLKDEKNSFKNIATAQTQTESSSALQEGSLQNISFEEAEITPGSDHFLRKTTFIGDDIRADLRKFIRA